MPAQELKTYRWLSQGREEESVVRPSWAEVESAIRALNNSDRNDLSLVATPETGSPSLVVGGGAGRYVLVGFDAGRSVTWINPVAPAGTTALVVGGQLGDYSLRHVASIEEALAAARAFYDAGSFACGIEWGWDE